MRRRLVIVAVVAGLAATGVPVAAVAQSEEPPPAQDHLPVTVHSPKGQEFGHWAERTRVAGDLNHDGINDLWVGVPGYQRDNRNYGRVYAVDGASLASPQGQKVYPKILYKIHPPEPQAFRQFGFFIENLGDLNGDATAEIVVGTDAQDVPVDPDKKNTQVCDTGVLGDEPPSTECNEQQGKAWVFDGKNNRVLYELNNPHPQGREFNPARFGSRLGRAGDVTGDGVSDIIAGASGNDDPPNCANTFPSPPGCRRDEGEAFIFDGKNGALIRQLNLPEEDAPDRPCNLNCGAFGLSVQGPGDVDGDGTADQLVGAPTLQVGPNRVQGRMYVFSGKTGDLIRRIDSPQPQPFSQFGFQDVTPLDPGDVNRDGHADLYAAAFEQDGQAGENGQGKAWVFNGAAGNRQETPMLYELQNPSPTARGQFGWSMTRDRNRTRPGDPADDADPVTNPLYVGNAPHGPGPAGRGDTNTFNAVTGTHLRNFPLPPPWTNEPRGPGGGPALGWTVSSPGDLNRDGVRDFLAGAPHTDVCHIRLGTMNKEEHLNQGVMIVFRSGPAGEPTPPSNDRNPADNVCTEDQQGGD